MPLFGSAQLTTTSRTPNLGSVEDMAARVRDIRRLAGSRAGSLDIVPAYRDDSIHRPDVDVERHREALSTLQEAGATWILVPGPKGSTERSLEFIEAFPKIYKQ
jgi:hypothetical protein